MKKVIIEFPLLTTQKKEETLYVYLAVATEAVSVVLLTKRKEKQCLVHYVSRTLNEAERNYAPLEKLALSLLHMSRRLRRTMMIKEDENKDKFHLNMDLFQERREAMAICEARYKAQME
nr:reverse transcriptase domain-containing protein [Tanacetum cinerariifolium]